MFQLCTPVSLTFSKRCASIILTQIVCLFHINLTLKVIILTYIVREEMMESGMVLSNKVLSTKYFGTFKPSTGGSWS